MRYILLLLYFLFVATLTAQEHSLKSWELAAEKDKRMLPEYGNQKKSQAELEADSRFINALVENGKTKKEGAFEMIRLGFNYLYKGDLKTSMYRFNQAFLLDAENPGIYQGYGAVYTALGAYELAREQYSQGLKLNPKNAPILTDYATTYLGEYYANIAQDQKKAQEKLDLAKEKFLVSFTVDPDYIHTAYKLSIVYLNIGDCANAKKYLNKTRALGGQPITKSYLSDFNLRCGNCTSVKTGRFQIESKQTGITTITRSKRFQIEENKSLNYKLKLKVDWLDDCTYELTPVADLTKERELPKEVLKCQIIEVNTDSYIQVSTANDMQRPLTSKLKILK